VEIKGRVEVRVGSRIVCMGTSPGAGFRIVDALCDGDRVMALGKASTKPGDGGDYRASAGARQLRRVGSLEGVAVAAIGASRLSARRPAITGHRAWLIAIPLMLLAICKLVGAHTRAVEECGNCASSGRCHLAFALPRKVIKGDLFRCVAIDADCVKTERCRILGDCAAVDGECSATKDDHCAHTPGCLLSGACSAVNGACVTAKDSDCAKTPSCASLGHCGVIDGACKATKDAHCVRSNVCVASPLGRCKASNGDCVTSDEACSRMEWCARTGECHAVRDDSSFRSCAATVDADCVQSALCRDEGRCTASAGGCIATRDEGCENGACTKLPSESARAPRSAQDCEASCRKAGKCAIVAGGTCVAATDADCRQSTECLTEARCTAKAGVCVATDASCRASWHCRVSGACSAPSGYCMATSDADCGESESCKADGRCTHRKGRCVLTKTEDCARSLGCAASGRCVAGAGFCTYSDDAYCRGSEACRELGECSAGDYRCAATSDKDCRASAVCKKYGWCESVDGKYCFVTRRPLP
jgi:hypothetical protein